MSGDIFAATAGRKAATGIKWVEARGDTDNQSSMHRTALTTMNYLAPHANSAEAEKTSSGCILVSCVQTGCVSLF